MMRTRPLLLILVCLFILGCARAPVAPIIVVSKAPQTRSLPAFNLVVVDGRMNVHLHTGYKKPQIILKGDSRDLAQVVTVVKNNELLVTLNPGYPRFGAVSADIRGRFLNSFTYRGIGYITGKHINSSSLDITVTNPGKTTLGGNIHLGHLEVHGPGSVEISGVTSQNLQLIMTGNPKVQLAGVVNMSFVTIEGDGSFGLHWVKSKFLTIRARGKSIIQLAGVAQKIDVELWDSARFNGRYLRVYNVFAKTHGKSVAEINAVGKQHTLATDASDIYFYEVPEMRADFMGYNGSVLDMRDWNNSFMEEYTRYNKYYASNS